MLIYISKQFVVKVIDYVQNTSALDFVLEEEHSSRIEWEGEIALKYGEMCDNSLIGMNYFQYFRK